MATFGECLLVLGDVTVVVFFANFTCKGDFVEGFRDLFFLGFYKVVVNASPRSHCSKPFWVGNGFAVEPRNALPGIQGDVVEMLVLLKLLSHCLEHCQPFSKAVGFILLYLGKEAHPVHRHDVGLHSRLADLAVTEDIGNFLSAQAS